MILLNFAIFLTIEREEVAVHLANLETEFFSVSLDQRELLQEE